MMDRGSEVRDRTLYPYSHTPLDPTLYQEKCLGDHLMDGVRRRLSEKGQNLEIFI